MANTNIPNTEITIDDIKKDIEANNSKSNDLDYQFPMNIFPTSIQKIVDEFNNAFQLPVDFYGMAILLISSGVIGNSFKLFVKSGYVEHSILYGAIVGRSSMGKTPALNMCLKPVKEIEKKLSEKFKVELARWRTNKNEGLEDIDDRPKANELLLNNATLEAVYGSLSNNNKGLIMFQDELMGWIKGLNQYRAGGDVEAWLSINSNSIVKINRASGDPVAIHNAAVSVIGGIQPTLLKELGNGKMHNGFMARILFAYPIQQKKPYMSEYETDEAYIDQYGDIITRLYELSESTYENEDPKFLVMTDRAKRTYYEWNDSYTDLINRTDRDSLISYYGKLQGYCLRFAIVLELLDYICLKKNKISDVRIESKRIKQAIELTDYFRRTGERVLNDIEKIGGVHKLDERQANFYRALPNKEFTTKEAVEIGRKVKVPERTAKDFIKKKDLFNKINHGVYCKKYL